MNTATSNGVITAEHTRLGVWRSTTFSATSLCYGVIETTHVKSIVCVKKSKWLKTTLSQAHVLAYRPTVGTHNSAQTISLFILRLCQSPRTSSC